MAPSSGGRIRWRIFGVQLLIVVTAFTLYKVYLPYHQRDLSQRAAAARDGLITNFFQDAVADDPQDEVSALLNGQIVKRHPQKLRLMFSPQEIESNLGVPNASTTDFNGAQHLSWVGNTHRLDASFNAGHLYCLGLEDRATGHGVLVYESPQAWHPY